MPVLMGLLDCQECGGSTYESLEDAMIDTLRAAYECAVTHTDDATLLTDLRLGMEAAEVHLLRGETRQLAEVVAAFTERFFDLCAPALWASDVWDHWHRLTDVCRELGPDRAQMALEVSDG